METAQNLSAINLKSYVKAETGEQSPITPFSRAFLPLVHFYDIPDEYKDLPVSAKSCKPIITNWEFIKDRDFDLFYQGGSSLFIWKNKVMDGISIGKIGTNWPPTKLVPRKDIIIENVPYYTLIYKIKFHNGPEEEVVCCDDFGNYNPIIISKRLVRDSDDVAVYIGKYNSHE